jgi:hypothetical protein
LKEIHTEHEKLKQQLDWLKRQLFGRESEKVLVANPAQSSLFETDETNALPAETKPVKAHTGPHKSNLATRM